MSESVAAPVNLTRFERLKEFVLDIEHDAAVAVLEAQKELKRAALAAETDVEALIARVKAAI